jgi:quercetin dioxygenase-like cupin family protein
MGGYMAVFAKRSAEIILMGVTLATIGLWPRMTCADAPGASNSTVKELMARDLIGADGKEIRMLTVEYVAGGASLPHRHDAQVFVYVLSGAVTRQVEGSAPVTLGPGGTFYEAPEDIHTVSANASQTKPARILVFIVKDKKTPVSSPVASKGHP